MLNPSIQYFRERARRARGEIFRRRFSLTPETVILDLGSGTGAHIASVLAGTPVSSSNVYIADIARSQLREGESRFGFKPVELLEVDHLPFSDGFFDIVFCSSVIEHVTIPKAEIWNLRSGSEFARRAVRRQEEFAAEIRRVGRGYFVQTPNKWFPIESHTWLPFVGYLPRRLQLPLLRATNRLWIQGTAPDWHLLDATDMARLFPDAELEVERFMGLPKSIMAIKEVDAHRAPLRSPSSAQRNAKGGL